MKAIELIENAETEKAIDLLIKEARSKEDKDVTKQLTILKANLKKTKQRHLLGLVTDETERIVTGKTNEYLLGYINGDTLNVDKKDIAPRLKGIAKTVGFIFSIGLFLIAMMLLYLRRDIINQLLVHQNFQVDFYLLFAPIIFLVFSIYLFFKLRSYD